MDHLNRIYYIWLYIEVLSIMKGRISHPNLRGETMAKKEKEQLERQKNLNKFNSVTQKVKPENQNQTHNVRKEGIGPINQKR